MKTLNLILVISAVVILFIVGVLLDWKGFVVNLFASAIVVIISITIINQLLLRQRRNQWKLVRSQIISAILNHIGYMTSEYKIGIVLPREYDLIAFVNETGTGFDTPELITSQALLKMADNMKLAPKPEDSREQSEKLHEIIKWDIEQIRTVLLPRVLAMETDEPELVSVLSELDNADRYWVNQYIVDKEISIGEQFEAATRFLKCMADVYKYLLEHPS